VTLSRPDAAVEVGGGEAGLQRRRLNRPAPQAARNSHLLSRLVSRPFMNRIHLYPGGRQASIPYTTSQSVSRGECGEGGQEQGVVNGI